MRRLIRFLTELNAWIVQPIVIFAILGVGFLMARELSSAREAPSREAAARYAPLVRAARVEPSTQPITVQGNGSLEPRTRIALVPQVGGRVVEVHPNLRRGGRFAAGETLVRIESIDYELAVARARADVTSTRTALLTLEAEASTAREEWADLHGDEPPPPLVARDPQLREAEARVEAALAQLERAQLDLDRTRLWMPFEGRVVEASTDVGEVLHAMVPLGTVYSIERFEVPVPLRTEELDWLRLPYDGAERTGSSAEVLVLSGSRTLRLPGSLVRLEGTLDPTSRLARVVVEVRLDGMDEDVIARLLPGTFVDVHFEGPLLEDAVVLPRVALRSDNVVWTTDGERLRFETVTPRHGSEDAILVQGLEPGTLVVTSPLEVATDGMEVRVLVEGEPVGSGVER